MNQHEQLNDLAHMANHIENVDRFIVQAEKRWELYLDWLKSKITARSYEGNSDLNFSYAPEDIRDEFKRDLLVLVKGYRKKLATRLEEKKQDLCNK